MTGQTYLRRIAGVLAIGSCLAFGIGCGGSDDATDVDAHVPADDAGETGEFDASGSGALCGGFSGASCEPDLYCDYADNQCGSSEGEGRCREAPTGCGGVYEPACGCDGEVYSNACEARASGVDLSAGGGCEAPEEMFACGYGFCDPEVAYCQRVLSDVVGEPSQFECVPYPEACDGAPDCACLADELCGEQCDEDDGALTLTCPGG